MCACHSSSWTASPHISTFCIQVELKSKVWIAVSGQKLRQTLYWSGSSLDSAKISLPLRAIQGQNKVKATALVALGPVFHMCLSAAQVGASADSSEHAHWWRRLLARDGLSVTSNSHWSWQKILSQPNAGASQATGHLLFVFHNPVCGLPGQQNRDRTS